MKIINYIIIILSINYIFSQKILIPMDQDQSDHLKAYGIAFWSLENGDPLNWLLNYRGGSFLFKKFCYYSFVSKNFGFY